MALAVACMILAFATFAFVLVVPTVVQLGWKYALPGVQILPVYLFFTLPGWFLALPCVIYFKNADGWRAWAILGIGTAIGPCFLVSLTLIPTGRINLQGAGTAVLMALSISFLTTLFYVLLLRRFTKAFSNAPS
jgi:hypothetical protein